MYYKIVSSPVLLSDCISSFSREVDVFLSHHEGKGTDAHAELAQTVFEFFKYVHQTADDASCVLPDHASYQDKDAFRDYFEKFKAHVLAVPLGERSQVFNGVSESIQSFKFRSFWNPVDADAGDSLAKSGGTSPLRDSGFSSMRSSPDRLSIPLSKLPVRSALVSKTVSALKSPTLTDSYLIPQNDADRYECKKVLNKAGKVVKWGVFQKADASGPERVVYGWEDYQAKLSVKGYSMKPIKNEMFFRVSCPPNFDEACRMIYRIANGKDNYELRGAKIYVFDLDRSFDADKLFKERLAKDKLFTRDFGALKTPRSAQGICDALNKNLT